MTRPEPRREGMAPSCPTIKRMDDDLVGCGSTRVVWDPSEGVYDCLECGMWFAPDEAEWVRTEIPRVE